MDGFYYGICRMCCQRADRCVDDSHVWTSQSELGITLQYPVLDRAIKFYISSDFALLKLTFLSG